MGALCEPWDSDGKSMPHTLYHVRTVHAPDGAERGAPQALLEGQGENDGPRGDEDEQPGREVGVLGEVPQLGFVGVCICVWSVLDGRSVEVICANNFTYIQTNKRTYLLPVENGGEQPIQEPGAPPVCCLYLFVVGDMFEMSMHHVASRPCNSPPHRTHTTMYTRPENRTYPLVMLCGHLRSFTSGKTFFRVSWAHSP